MSKQVSLEVFQRALPKQVRGNLTQAMVDNVNLLLAGDEQDSAHLRDGLLGWTSIMRDGKFTLKQYVNAVRYVCFKMQDATNEEAYAKTFPERYQSLLDQGLDSRRIGGYVSQFNKGLLVQKIFEQSMIPVYIFNAEIYQKAINTQAHLMVSANSELVQTQAANSLLTHLRPPDTSKIEIDMTVKEDKVIHELRSTIAELSAIQKRNIQSGLVTVKDVAHSKLIHEVIDVEATDVDEEARTN
jgi:hypothetical protein